MEYQLKLRTGRETDKSEILSLLKKTYTKANSRKEFYAMLEINNAKTYLRSGKITGIFFNNRKYCFNRLGFTEELLNELDKIRDRNRELKNTRKGQIKSQNRGVSR